MGDEDTEHEEPTMNESIRAQIAAMRRRARRGVFSGLVPPLRTSPGWSRGEP